MGALSSITSPEAILGSGALSAGTSLLGSSQSSSAASNAAALQQQQYQTTRSDLLPYNTVGQSADAQLGQLNSGGWNAGQPNYLTAAAGSVPNANTMAGVVNTPGYQFNLNQGLQATQNAAAAKGLGVSGAELKGAATFATGLADGTYQNQFNNQQSVMQDNLNLNTAQQGNTTNLYNRLSGTAGLGENAGSATGTQGTAAANAAGGYITQAGQLGAAGTLGVGNAATSAANSYAGNNALQSYLSNGGTAGYGGLTGGNGNWATTTFTD